MKAITLWQPWASLVALRYKHYETRSWATTHRAPLAIHAAKRPPTEDEFNVIMELDAYLPRGVDLSVAIAGLPLGVIVATCNLHDCTRMDPEQIANMSGASRRRLAPRMVGLGPRRHSTAVHADCSPWGATSLGMAGPTVTV